MGGWGLGVGGWGMGVWPQPPIPNPQSPIPNPQSPKIKFKLNLKNKRSSSCIIIKIN